MPITAPKCKICGEPHWGSVCTKFNRGRKPDIKAIESTARSATSKPKKPGRGKNKA